MATPRGNSYAVASGGGVYAGVDTPPGWGSGAETGSIAAHVWTPGRTAAGYITQASVDTLAANVWYRVAGTSLQSLKTLVEATGFSYSTDEWSNGKDIRDTFRAWVGAADDGRRMYVPRGGGHADASLNMVAALDVLKMRWECHKAPSIPTASGAAWSSNYDIPPNGTFSNYTTTGGYAADVDGLYQDMLPDGSPTSTHTYTGVWYDSTRNEVGTGRVSKWSYSVAARDWTRQRWTDGGGSPTTFTVNQMLHYHAGQDALYGYFALSDMDGYSFGKCVFPGANRVSVSACSNWVVGNGGVACSVRLDDDRVLFIWQVSSVERWGIFDMSTETWESGSGNAITDGVVYDAGHDMQIALYVPDWGSAGQVIRRGTEGAIDGNWWIFDIASKANVSYSPAGATIPNTVWPGNKWRTLQGLGVAIGIDDTSTISSDAVFVMRYE